MKMLEHKIPPPLVAFIFALLMWLLNLALPGFDTSSQIRTVIALFVFCIGIAFTLPGLIAFKRKGTTINPLAPDKASSLVQDGIYKITRNPMYFGMLMYLIAWAIFLSNLFTTPLVIGFVVYMNKFQIEPEEKALSAIFGEDYKSYTNKVRRWL